MTTLKEAAKIMSAAAHKSTPRRTAHCQKMSKLPRRSGYVCRHCGHVQSTKWINQEKREAEKISCFKCGSYDLKNNLKS